jgi:hypothetical protein
VEDTDGPATKPAYQLCAPLFKELVALIKNDPSEVEEFEAFMKEKIVLFKKKKKESQKAKEQSDNCETVSNSNGKRPLVSSAISTEMLTKTHGTKYFRT